MELPRDAPPWARILPWGESGVVASVHAMDPALLEYFDHVCDKIAAHSSYSMKLDEAARVQAQLVLNYHTHGPGQGYCVSVCARDESLALLELPASQNELAHIRDIGKSREECGPLMEAFAERLVDRYGLKRRPVIFLDGAPLTGH